MNYKDIPSYIVIEGPIGVGKTTLAKKLATTFESELILEQPQENPFLERFYHSPRSYALPTQLSFLFQRAKMLQSVKQQRLFNNVQISDYLFQKDLLFAEMNLDDDEYDLYRQVYERLSPEVPAPDLVVYLQAPVETLQGRIRKRGIGYENLIESNYLQILCDSYSRYFLRYNQTPLLVVNSDKVNFAENESEYKELLKEILSIKNGKHFFNPMGSS